MTDQFKGARILITGGLGFIGLNIAKRLIDLNAQVTVLSDRDYQSGSPEIIAIKKRINIVIADIREKEQIKESIKGQDVIFNLAGISGASESMKDPYTDLDINCLGQINILLTCRDYNPQAKIIFAGSQLEYGKPEASPLTEESSMNPISFHGIHKLSGENYHRLCYRIYQMNTTVFRISNPYGPLRQMQTFKFVLPNLFIKQAITGEPIKIFGDGKQRRMYLYIDDLVDAFLLAAIKDESRGKVYNVAGDVPVEIIELARLVIETVGNGFLQQVPWPDDYKNPRIGDIVLDISRIKKDLAWQPDTCLAEGISHTYKYYNKRTPFYW